MSFFDKTERNQNLTYDKNERNDPCALDKTERNLCSKTFSLENAKRSKKHKYHI